MGFGQLSPFHFLLCIPFPSGIAGTFKGRVRDGLKDHAPQEGRRSLSATSFSQPIGPRYSLTQTRAEPIFCIVWTTAHNGHQWPYVDCTSPPTIRTVPHHHNYHSSKLSGSSKAYCPIDNFGMYVLFTSRFYPATPLKKSIYDRTVGGTAPGKRAINNPYLAMPI